MRATCWSAMTIAFAVACIAPFSSRGDEPAERSLAQLKREVADAERQLNIAQCNLAEARARVALAEGKRGEALGELRKAEACRQSEIEWIRTHANRYCDPREMMTEAQWNLAKTRAWLAEVEGDVESLVVERKKIVAIYEERRERIRKLEQLGAASPEDAHGTQAELEAAKKLLADAEKRRSGR